MENQSGGAGGFIVSLISLLLVVFVIVSMWKVFTKAGQPGWAVLIPIYNVFILCKIAGKPGWWVLLFFIPLVNFIMAILVALGVAEQFGRGALFGLGLAFVPFIFYPILAFGDSAYGGTSDLV